MSWFGQKRTTGKKLPFPAERLSALGTIVIPGAIFQALRLRQKSELSAELIWNSQFLNTYVCAYPDFLDGHDPELGGIARWGLLRALLAGTDEEAQLRCDTFKIQFESGDPVTIRIAQLAAGDGSHYFRALLASVDADERATANLILAIRGFDDFPSFIIPASGL